MSEYNRQFSAAAETLVAESYAESQAQKQLTVLLQMISEECALSADSWVQKLNAVYAWITYMLCVPNAAADVEMSKTSAMLAFTNMCVLFILQTPKHMT